MEDDNEDHLKNKEDLHIAGRHTALDIFRFAVFFKNFLVLVTKYRFVQSLNPIRWKSVQPPSMEIPFLKPFPNGLTLYLPLNGLGVVGRI